MDCEDFDDDAVDSPHSSGRNGPPEDVGGLTPQFKLIFFTVVALTVLALMLSVVSAVFGTDSDQAKSAAEASSTTYKMGFGAIVGLVGSRRT